MKKLLSIIMMACMIVTLTPIACGGVLIASADDTTSANTITVDKIVYTLSTDGSNTAEITGYEWISFDATSLDIPSKVTDSKAKVEYTVTAIAEDVSIGGSKLVSVNIPSTITSIGNGAFGGCTNLKTITVDSANRYYCTEDNVLFDINKTTLIKCGVGKAVEYTIPNTVTKICDYAFYNCKQLTGITIPNSVISIGDEAFRSCEKLTKMSIPNSVTSIGDRAFRGCTGLTSADIPNSVTEIGDEAFRGCSGLVSIHIPSSVMEIGTGAFRGCTKLAQIKVDEESNSFMADDNVLFNKDQTSIIFYPATYPKAEGVTSYTIPDTVTRIEDCAFYKNEKLTSVTIPTNLTYIGDCAFCENTSLEKVGNQEFMDDENATGVKIPASVTYLGTSAFYGDTSLTSLIFESGSKLKEIGREAFADCSNLKSLTFAYDGELETIGSSAFKNCNFSELKINESIPGIKIPASVKSINSSAFRWSQLKGTVTFADNSRLTEIGSMAFYECVDIMIMDLPESVEKIGYRIFYSGARVWLIIYYGGSEEQWNNIKVDDGCTLNAEYLVGCDKAGPVYKKSQVAPVALEASEIGYNKITLTSIGDSSSTGASAQYRIAGGVWQDSTEFAGLVAGRTYTFEARYKSTANTEYHTTEEAKKGYAPSDAISANFTTLAYVKFDSDGGTTVDEKTRVLETDYVLANVENPTKGGYTFAGWKYGNKSVTATTTYKELVADDNTIEGITLVAQWTPIRYGGSSKRTQTITEEQKQAEIEKAEAEKKAAEIAEVKTSTSGLSSLKARSSRTAKSNIKVVAKLSTAEEQTLAELTDLGYTVKYRFYRSTKKSAGYKAMLEGTTGTYINTTGESGTRYYYKCRVMVYDVNGTLVAKTALKQCKYATRVFGQSITPQSA